MSFSLFLFFSDTWNKYFCNSIALHFTNFSIHIIQMLLRAHACIKYIGIRGQMSRNTNRSDPGWNLVSLVSKLFIKLGSSFDWNLWRGFGFDYGFQLSVADPSSFWDYFINFKLWFNIFNDLIMKSFFLFDKMTSRHQPLNLMKTCIFNTEHVLILMERLL